MSKPHEPMIAMDAPTCRTMHIRSLVAKAGGPTDFAKKHAAYGWSQGQISQWISAKNPKGIGSKLARKIEAAAGMRHGEMDMPVGWFFDEKAFMKSLQAMTQKMARAIEGELKSMPRSGLEEYWFFRWNDAATVDQNIYKFTYLLELYRRRCRQWEEIHNGSACVVERVRDQYLMPKINEFSSELTRRLSK